MSIDELNYRATAAWLPPYQHGTLETDTWRREVPVFVETTEHDLLLDIDFDNGICHASTQASYPTLPSSPFASTPALTTPLLPQTIKPSFAPSVGGSSGPPNHFVTIAFTPPPHVSTPCVPRGTDPGLPVVEQKTVAFRIRTLELG